MGFFTCRNNKKHQENIALRKALSEFRSPLIEMKVLSERLDYPSFTKIFEDALNILDANLSNQKKATRLIAKTNILGGMGTWGDSPPWTAHQLGISSEFDKVTKRFSIARSELEIGWKSE